VDFYNCIINTVCRGWDFGVALADVEKVLSGQYYRLPYDPNAEWIVAACT
jgi:hypothetical protein